ncbi:hypothetical protein [Enhygromyxa salina]|nr:hypothetical protein [Enhygromyxa salina]
MPADLPPEPEEFAGILYTQGFPAPPSRFVLCDTGEFVEWVFPWSLEEAWSGSCDGVYHRVRGRLDRDFDPPRLIVDPIVESRWCEPDDCGGGCVPQLDTCYAEHDVPNGCDPLISQCGDDRCIPERFWYATEVSGWMFHVCTSEDKTGVTGDACNYTDSPKGEIDDCADNHRCWNPEGDTTSPGTCVPYCDVEGELGPACDGACIPCSATERGLCVSGCSGEDCRVDEFC